MIDNPNESGVDDDATNSGAADATNSLAIRCGKEAIGARIREIADELQTGPSAMAAKLGLALGSYKNYATGQRSPGAEAIAAFVGIGVNSNWLLTGEGPRWTEAIQGLKGPVGDFVTVSLYDVRASAGHGAWNPDELPAETLAFRRDWVRREISSQPDQLVLVYVDGDSMEPELKAGDVVMIDRFENSFGRDGIYVLMLDDHMVIKRLQRLSGHMVRVSSANASYAPFEMEDVFDDADHWIVGRAVWAGRRL